MNRKVKSLMMLEGIKSVDIARTAKVTPTWVSLVLNNRKKSDRIRAIIAAALKMRVEELWGENKAA